MSNWRLLQRIQDFLGVPAAPLPPSQRELDRARDLRRNGWALSSFDKKPPRPTLSDGSLTLTAPPPPKSK